MADNGLSDVADITIDIATAIAQVIPLALEVWENLVDHVFSGQLLADKARTIFGSSTLDVKHEIRMMLTWRRKSIDTSGAVGRVGPYLKAVDEASTRVVKFLAVHSSIEWLIDAVPSLLRVRVALHEASCHLEDDEAISEKGEGPAASTTDAGIVETKASGADDKSHPSSRMFVVTPMEDLSCAALEKIHRDILDRFRDMSMNEIFSAWQSVESWIHGETGGGDKERGQSFEDSARASRPPDRETSMPRHWRSYVECLVALTENPDLLEWLMKVRESYYVIVALERRYRYGHPSGVSVVSFPALIYIQIQNENFALQLSQACLVLQ